MFCRDHVAQLRDHEDAIVAAGGAVAAIGTGDLDYARDFRESREIGFPLFVDPKLTTYRAVGTRKGSVLGLAKPAVVAAAALATARGSLQGKTGPAPLILGATHVVRPDGSVPYAWINADYADNAPISDAIEALGS